MSNKTLRFLNLGINFHIFLYSIYNSLVSYKSISPILRYLQFHNAKILTTIMINSNIIFYTGCLETN